MIEIPKEWKISITRDGGWIGLAEKKMMTHKVEITAWDNKYPTFQDCYHVLAEKIKMYEMEKTK